jgi:hypothetical protein
MSIHRAEIEHRDLSDMTDGTAPRVRLRIPAKSRGKNS